MNSASLCFTMDCASQCFAMNCASLCFAKNCASMYFAGFALVRGVAKGGNCTSSACDTDLFCERNVCSEYIFTFLFKNCHTSLAVQLY